MSSACWKQSSTTRSSEPGRLFDQALTGLCFGEQGQKVRLFHRHAQLSVGVHPLTYRWNAFDSLSRHRLRPASEDRSERGVASKSMLGGNAHRSFRPLMSGVTLSAELPEERGAVQRHRHTIGMRQILRQGKGLR